MKNFKEIREKYRSKFPPALVAAAVKIALDMGGNMTGAYKKIEAMKRGLADDPIVKDALRQANESVNESTDGSFKLVDMDDKSYKNALMLAKKAKLNPFSKKTSTGMELSVFGDNKSIMKFLKSLPESVQTVKEGTMAIGVKDRDPNKREKAIDGMRKLVKSIKGSTKVGSPQGQKFADELDMKYLSDDELADDFADPKNKNKSIKDIMNKHAKRLNIKFN